MAKSVRLWVREDGEQPKAIPGDGSLPPGPGLVVDVTARSSVEARQVYALAAGADVAEERDPDGWNEQRKARRRVALIARFVRGADGVLRGVTPATAEANAARLRELNAAAKKVETKGGDA